MEASSDGRLVTHDRTARGASVPPLMNGGTQGSGARGDAQISRKPPPISQIPKSYQEIYVFPTSLPQRTIRVHHLFPGPADPRAASRRAATGRTVGEAEDVDVVAVHTVEGAQPPTDDDIVETNLGVLCVLDSRYGEDASLA